MNTTTKVIVGAAAVFGIATYLKKKKNQEAATPSYSDAGTTLPQQTYEGKLVVKDNGNWFVVLNGQRWYTANVQAIVDFQNKYPGNETPIEGLTEEQLAAYPISGHIYENLELRPFNSTRRLGEPTRQIPVCVRTNPDGSTTTYSQQGGDRPCPYGGKVQMPRTLVSNSFTGLGNPMFLGI
ncbi:hypothetical protein [Flavobacterium capsici]|uniref:Uncharacterized protein n=1 Tax=Flavobacterium capsici TaxID=3075618 RepID=A0AA96F3J0_9FLAO|nr:MULTISPECIES: hypothetical protein [unclassified Flavobacterium]WNM19286.1 hypothetical protein RN608_01055 [Flavobacterium sp. PMR2A8]WNM20675.1 hypothetical protein RN605_08225 [Flavobacterium sp. PMTSA4]